MTFAPKSLIKALLLVGFFFALCFGIFTIYIANWYSQGLMTESPGQSFVVEKGWSVHRIADKLEDQGLISHPDYFTWVARLLGYGKNIHAGEYLLSSSMSPAGILMKFIKGDVIFHQVTVPEGVSSYQVVEILNRNPELEGAVKKFPTEGILLPETYTFQRGTSRESLLREMEEDMQAMVDFLWCDRSVDTPLRSKEEMIILASIIEKETSLPAERPLVAAVFLNRLRIGMPLQADPTVVYGLTQGKGALGRRLLRKDLEAPNDYNTYLNAGLPPGPIANPGKSALEAVIHPASVDYLYFVADGSGGHVFASSADEHAKNHVKWRKIRKDMEKNQ